MRKYSYLLATLTEQEREIYNNREHHNDTHAYLYNLVEDVQTGVRHMYIYNPAPATQPRVETRETRIATIREAQNNNQQIATIRAGLPERIPTRVIAREQVQHELNLQNEEELQQTIGDVNRVRAENLNDPELTGDAVIIARYLEKITS